MVLKAFVNNKRIVNIPPISKTPENYYKIPAKTADIIILIKSIFMYKILRLNIIKYGIFKIVK